MNWPAWLYHNTHDDYKLGAGFAKPIIIRWLDSPVCPRFQCKDEEEPGSPGRAGKPLGEPDLQRTHQLSLRDGEFFLMLANLENDDPLYPDERKPD